MEKQFEEKQKTSLEEKKRQETVEEMKKMRMCQWNDEQLYIFCGFSVQQQREFDEEHDKLNHCSSKCIHHLEFVERFLNVC